MMKFNKQYFLCWREIKMSHGTLRAGKQEIVNDEWHSEVDREKFANEQSEMMNDIYGQNTHWIEES